MCLCLTHPSIWRIALFGRLWLVAGADFCQRKVLLAGWWLMPIWCERKSLLAV